MAPGRSTRRQDHSQHLTSVDDSGSYTLEAPVPSRTNAQLNLSVLQRHNPSIVHVLSIAPYAVIYVFSPSLQTWEKTGIEGTLFVCRLEPNGLAHDATADELEEERYMVMVLNRRGLDNFQLDLQHADSVEVTDEYVILQGTEDHVSETGDGGDDGVEGRLPAIYGLWIFAEPPPSSTADMRVINAKVIQDCASRAEASRNAIADRRRKRMEQASGADAVMPYHMAQPSSAPQAFTPHEAQSMGYGVQGLQTFNGYAEPQSRTRSGDVLGDLFRRARQEYGSNG